MSPGVRAAAPAALHRISTERAAPLRRTRTGARYAGAMLARALASPLPLRLIGALAATTAAWAWFASTPPMRVLVGTTALEEPVPLLYQVAFFPAFGAFIGGTLQEALRRRGLPWERAALVGASTALGTVRLAGLVPLSGHGTILAAIACFEILRRREPAWYVAAGLAILGLVPTVAYKLAWGDVGWLAASVAVGVGLALGLRRVGARVGAARRRGYTSGPQREEDP